MRPPFPRNYVAYEGEAKSIEDHIHHFGDLDPEIHITKEESKQYQRGYLCAIDDVQRKIKLRNRDVTVNKGRFNQNQYSSSQQNTGKKKERKTSFHDMQENSQ